MNAYEARLLGVERQLMMLGRRAQVLERETWAGLQDALELWQEVPPGAAGCPNTKIQFTVRGCPTLPVASVPVTVVGGGSTYTGSTNGSGVVLIDVSATGAATYSWTAADPSPGRFTGTSGTVATTCGATATVTTTLTPNTTPYVCTTPCSWPLKKSSLIVTNSFGTATLTWTSGVTWTGTQTITTPTVQVPCVLSAGVLICNGATVAGGALTVTWSYNANTQGLSGTYRQCPTTRFATAWRPIDDSVAACGSTASVGFLTSGTPSCPPSYLTSGTSTDLGAGVFAGLAWNATESP